MSPGVTRDTASARVITPALARSRAIRKAARGERLPVRHCSM